MPTDPLDNHELRYLDSSRRPRLAWQRAFFLCLLPAFGAASMVTQWTRGIDQTGMLLTGAVFFMLALIYFPMAWLTSRQYSPDIVTWSGAARVVPASTGQGHENYVGETRVILPIAWAARFMAMRGRVFTVRGVRMHRPGTDLGRRVIALSLGEEMSVRREVPLGLADMDFSEFYFGLALLPVGALVILAARTRFHLEFFLYFGLVSAVFVLYGLRVKRKNVAIQRAIDATRGPLSAHLDAPSDALRKRR